MHGGAGDDTFYVYSEGMVGVLDGGEGYDKAVIDFHAPDQGFVFDAAPYATIEEFKVTVTTGYNGVTLYGGDGNDQFASYDSYKGGPSGNDYMDGRGGDDVLYGGSGADHLIGGDGNDILDGDYGVSGIPSIYTDTLEGGAGNDTLYGGLESDILDGGIGADTLNGGSGADTFVWDEATARLNGGIDHITDFDTAGGDVISLRGFASSSTGIHDFDSFLAASHDTAAGVYVSFDGDTNGILIEGVTLADLSADDVMFS